MTILILFIRAHYFPDIPDFTNLTWLEMQKLCPRNTISFNCKNTIEGKTVKNWDGYVMKVDDQR